MDGLVVWQKESPTESQVLLLLAGSTLCFVISFLCDLHSVTSCL